MNFPVHEIYAIGALLVFPEARERAEALGVGLIFTDELAAALAVAIIWPSDDNAERLAFIGGDRAALLLELADSAASMMGRQPDGAAWGVFLLERLAAEHGDALVVPSLRWAADQVERGTRSVSEVLDELRPLMVAAGGDL